MKNFTFFELWCSQRRPDCNGDGTTTEESVTEHHTHDHIGVHTEPYTDEPFVPTEETEENIAWYE